MPAITEEPIGKVVHYFGKIQVAAIELKEPLAKGTRVHIRGHTTDLTQAVDSLQINHRPVPYAVPGENVAIRVNARVRPNDVIFRVLKGGAAVIEAKRDKREVPTS